MMVTLPSTLIDKRVLEEAAGPALRTWKVNANAEFVSIVADDELPVTMRSTSWGAVSVPIAVLLLATVSRSRAVTFA